MKLFGFLGARKPAPVVIDKSQPPVLKRSYAAAGNAPRYNDFKASQSKGSADYELLLGLSTLREKSRSLARNSPMMRRYIQLMQDNVVGEAGFILRSKAKMADMKTLDAALNDRVQVAWADWWAKPTVDGEMDGAEMLAQNVGAWCRDGEVLIEIVVSGSYMDSLSLNPLEADLLDETLNSVYPPTGNQIRMGVEINELGRPVAYHLLTLHPGDPGWYAATKKKRYRRVTADRIIHVFDRQRPGQTRGEPPAAGVINSMKMLDGYREAETTNRRVSAATMGFFIRDKVGASGIDALATDENAATGELQMDLEPGTFKELPEGLRFEKFEAHGSTTDYKQFETALKRDQSGGLGISAFSLAMETDGVSYSTSRSVMLEDRMFYSRKRRMFVKMLKRIFGVWVKMHTLSDRSTIPPTKMENVIRNAMFRGAGWAWIDPSKDVKANAEALRTRQTSLSRIAADRGIDFVELVDEIVSDEAMLKLAGLTITFDEGKDSQTEDGEDDVSTGSGNSGSNSSGK